MRGIDQQRFLREQSLGATTNPLPFLAPRQITSQISMRSWGSLRTQLILLLLPVPVSIMMCLFLQKNMRVISSQSQYMVLKSGTWEMSTTQKVTKLLSLQATFMMISSICMHLGVQSWPQRITTSFSGSVRMAWSTSQPLSRCGSRNDIIRDYLININNSSLATVKTNHLPQTFPLLFTSTDQFKLPEFGIFGLCTRCILLISCQLYDTSLFETAAAMTEFNDSNTDMNGRVRPVVYQEDEDDPKLPNLSETDLQRVADSIQTVPRKLPPRPLSTCFIIINILLNICPILLLALYASGDGLSPILMVPVTLVVYIVYLVSACKYSNLMGLVKLSSLEQHRLRFQELSRAGCLLTFKYVPPRSKANQIVPTCYNRYEDINIVDRSGVLSEVQKGYSVLIVDYRKKYFFTDSVFKGQVYGQFKQFVQNSSRGVDSRQAVPSKQKIKFTVQGMVHQVAYRVQDDACCCLYLMLILGLAIYYQKYMQSRVVRCQLDIVKELCPRQPK